MEGNIYLLIFSYCKFAALGLQLSWHFRLCCFNIYVLCLNTMSILSYKKVKESRDMPGVAQRVPGRLDFHDIRHMKVVRLSASHTGRLYPQEIFLVLIFIRGWVDPRAMVRSEGSISLKNPVTPPGIDPGTVRLVVKRLNHYATLGPSLS